MRYVRLAFACEMILAMLSNLLWARSLMAPCFSCSTIKILKDFRVMTFARERSRLVPLKVMPTGRPTPVANAAIAIPSVITVYVIRPVSMTHVTVLNRFICFASRLRTSISSSKYACTSFNLFMRYVCGSCGAVGFNSG